MPSLFRNRVGLAGIVLVVAGIWLLCLSVASATAAAYPSAYWPSYFAAAAGVALVVSGGVLAGVFLGRGT